jgi:hypothetical protein
MIERSALIGLAAYIGGIILGLILILCAFAFIGLCVAVMFAVGTRAAQWLGVK